MDGFFVAKLKKYKNGSREDDEDDKEGQEGTGTDKADSDDEDTHDAEKEGDDDDDMDEPPAKNKGKQAKMASTAVTATKKNEGRLAQSKQSNVAAEVKSQPIVASQAAVEKKDKKRKIVEGDLTSTYFQLFMYELIDTMYSSLAEATAQEVKKDEKVAKLGKEKAVVTSVKDSNTTESRGDVEQPGDRKDGEKNADVAGDDSVTLRCGTLKDRGCSNHTFLIVWVVVAVVICGGSSCRSNFVSCGSSSSRGGGGGSGIKSMSNSSNNNCVGVGSDDGA
jgi:hypothetical protein